MAYQVKKQHKGIIAIVVYVLVFAAIIIYVTDSEVLSPTGKVVMIGDKIPQQTFNSILFIIIGFGIALGIILDFNFRSGNIGLR